MSAARARRHAARLGARLLCFLALLVPSPATAQAPPRHAPDTILVRFREFTALPERAHSHASIGARVHRSFTLVDGLQVVRVPRGMRVKDAIEFYQRHPAVLYAEPNWIVQRQVTPNDPSLGQLWGLSNSGQSGGVPDADIDALEAWNLATGSSDVVVAVIDSGVDASHPDLAANMFRNTTDCNANGIDDDGNGYVDDCVGIDAAGNDSDPADDNNHGTHVAGTIGAAGNNGVGVVGVNWTVGLMACKFLAASGTGSTSDAIECMEYVKRLKDRGVNIVATNNSWGGSGFSQSLFDAIEAHLRRGILFIAAAGNNGSDNDATPFYPAGYYLPNVIAVAATTRTDALASFSNHGRQTVHLGAPGASILSTTPGNTYSFFSGTSMATPHVAGVAALLQAHDPARDWRAIKNLILAGGDPAPALGNTVAQRRLNARGALACTSSPVRARLRPVGPSITGAVGTPLDLAVLNIDCATPNGNVVVAVQPGGPSVTLADDGLGADQEAGDGVYSGRWTPTTAGTYSLAFPGGDAVSVQVLGDYRSTSASFSYRAIAGTSLNLDDDAEGLIAAPFEIFFGSGRFSQIRVSSNGTLTFTGPFTASANASIPTAQIATLVAPWWDDLVPVAGTAQNVFWDVLGSAPGRELVVEWRDVRHGGCATSPTATVKLQVVFFEGSNDVLFNYADTVFGGACAGADRAGSATVGVQTGTGSGVQHSFDAQSLTDGMAILWTMMPPPTLSVSPSSRSFGGVPVGGAEERSFTVQNLGGGIINGTATTSAPYVVVSGGSYTLAMGQSHEVTVRFTPTATGTFARNVTFTGAGGVTRAVTGAGVALAPVAPTGLVATAASSSQINLAWQDPNGNETESRIERKTGPGGTFAQIATAAADVAAHSSTGLSAGTTYVYRVRACNAVGCSPYSTEATATTPALGFVLNVTVRGSAPGTVTSGPPGISCDASCSASFPGGTIVTLTAMPGPGARFRSWGGACSGASTTCTVTMNELRSVTATFSLVFTDATAADLLPSGTTIKAIHFHELLDAINAVQGSSLTWDSPAPAAGGVVLAAHATRLRQGLGLGAIAPGSVIAAPHINEIRLRIRALE